ncbi:hypothetical protein V8B97DRAFT_1444014 [Scleroderma yunnanense]
MLPYSTRSGMFLLVVMVSAYVPTASANALNHLNLRNVISDAQCVPGFNWMNNQEGKDPCLTVAYVIAACVGDTWTQPALPPGDKYDAPNGTTATPCYCSWSCYNLMMACEWCQYPNNVTMALWSIFSQNCPSSYTNDYFPTGYTLLNNQTIPYWASIDPTKWTSGIFNVNQAQEYANQNVSDFNPSATSTTSGSKSSNLGAIVGGAVGGAAFLLILAFGVYYFCKRRRYNRLATTPPAADTNRKTNPSWQLHARQPSDPSTSFLQSETVSPAPMSYFTGSRSPPIPDASTRSLSVFTSYPAATPPRRAGSLTTNAPQHPGLPIV